MMPVLTKRTSQRKNIDTTVYTIIAVVAVFYIGRISTSSTSPATTSSEVASFQQYQSSKASEISRSNSDSNTLRSSSFKLDLKSDLPIEIWAQSQPHQEVADVRTSLNKTELGNLEELCGRTLYHGLQNVVVAHDNGQRSFFATG
jgi:hypothetical protein